jgi:hypothetical protein
MEKSSEVQRYWKKTKEILSNKKYQNIIVISLFLLTLFIGINIRVQPMIKQQEITRH